MSDLISRSDLIELIKSHDDITLDRFSELAVIRLIKEQPTAYNPDKVVEELGEKKEIVKEYEKYHYSVRLDDAIDIVKRGGVE